MTIGQKQYRRYLNSAHWKELRQQVIERDSGHCVRCGDIVPAEFIEVHHKLYRDDWHDAQLEDLETLCVECHTVGHGFPSAEQVDRQAEISGLLDEARRSNRPLPRTLRLGLAALARDESATFGERNIAKRFLMSTHYYNRFIQSVNAR